MRKAVIPQAQTGVPTVPRPCPKLRRCAPGRQLVDMDTAEIDIWETTRSPTKCLLSVSPIQPNFSRKFSGLWYQNLRPNLGDLYFEKRPTPYSTKERRVSAVLTLRNTCTRKNFEPSWPAQFMCSHYQLTKTSACWPRV
ncbi:unnamed protein product [Ectocarpus sp. 6 AP-2014]